MGFYSGTLAKEEAKNLIKNHVHQEFIERHEKFTGTLSQVAATIQEAQDGLAEMEMIEAGSVTAGFENPDVMSRLSQGPGSEEMVDASEQPQSRGVTDVENEE